MPSSHRHFRFIRRTSLRIAVVSLLTIALLLIPQTPLLIRGEAWSLTPGQSQQRREGNPRPGRPEATLKNLDAIRNETPAPRELPLPIPSTIRSRRNPLQPWDGRRFGDSLPNQGRASNDASKHDDSNSGIAPAAKPNEPAEARLRLGKRAHAARVRESLHRHQF